MFGSIPSMFGLSFQPILDGFSLGIDIFIDFVITLLPLELIVLIIVGLYGIFKKFGGNW